MLKHGNKLLPLLLVVVMLVGGCASTPREQYANVNDSFIAAVSTLTDAKTAGVFSDEEWNEDIVPLIRLGDTLLDEYDAATDADMPTEPITTRLQRVLTELQPFIIEATTDGREE